MTGRSRLQTSAQFDESVIAHQQIDLPRTRVGRDWMGPQSVEGICSYVGSNGPGSVKRSIDSTFA